MYKKSIVFICQNILSDENRTQYNRTRFLCNKFSVHVVAMGLVSTNASTSAESVHLFPIFRIFKFLFPIWVLWTILCIKRQYDIAFLYSTYEPLNIITSYIVKKIYKIKWIADIWDDPEKSLLVLKEIYCDDKRVGLLKFYKTVELLIAKKLLKRANKIVTLIPQQLREKYLVPQNKILPITNGINLNYNFNVHIEKNKDSIFTLIYTGTVDNIRLEGISHCLQEAVKKIKPFRLILIGYELNNGYSWVREKLRPFNDKIILNIRGIQKYDAVIQAIAESDVCICPYPNKIDLAPAFPIKLFDYMAVGRPIVASSLPGTRRIIQNGFNGLLFEPGDYLEMAQLIIKLYNSPKLQNYLSVNAKNSVHNFDWNRIHEKVFHFLENKKY